MFNVKKKKKIETGSRQNDGTIDKGQIQRFTLPHGPPPLEFPRQRARKQTRGWSSGEPPPTLSEFGSQEMDRPPHSGPPATSGKTPGTSLSQMIWLPKILTRNLSLTWGQDIEARNVLSEGHGHIGLPLSPLTGRCCAWNPSHIFGLSPGD